MRWRNIRHLQADAFKRLVGVNRDTFENMVSEVNRVSTVSKHKVSGRKRGPKPTLSIRDQVLMLLMYYREYRTFFHIASGYRISESQCWKIIIRVEQILIKSSLFHLPGKKKLTTDNKQWEEVVIDVAEHSVERPKKNREDITQEKRKAIH